MAPLVALVCAVLMPGSLPLVAQQPAAPARHRQQPASAGEKPKLKSADQLDSLVAPIALYPDPLLGQVLAASTYPLEIVQAQRWLKENSKLTGENLTKAAAKQPWDPSVQALVRSRALKLLDDNIQWTTDLGNAFLDQQSDVMDAVQRMRKKAKDGGKLETTQRAKGRGQDHENKTSSKFNRPTRKLSMCRAITRGGLRRSSLCLPPDCLSNPLRRARCATAAVSFGMGVMMGAMWSGCCHGGYGWGCGWGGNNNVTINNNFNQRYGYANGRPHNTRREDRINNSCDGGNRRSVRQRTMRKVWGNGARSRGSGTYLTARGQ